MRTSIAPTSATAAVRCPILALAAAGLLLAACDAAEDAGEAAVIDIVDDEFEPRELEIAVGDTVTWEHVGDAPHNVTFDDEESGNLDSGETFSRTFDETGTFEYTCTIHAGMDGTVTVSE